MKLSAQEQEDEDNQWWATLADEDAAAKAAEAEQEQNNQWWATLAATLTDEDAAATAAEAEQERNDQRCATLGKNKNNNKNKIIPEEEQEQKWQDEQDKHFMAQAAAKGPAVDPLVAAVMEQREVPWGGKQIDWATPKLVLILVFILQVCICAKTIF